MTIHWLLAVLWAILCLTACASDPWEQDATV